MHRGQASGPGVCILIGRCEGLKSLLTLQGFRNGRRRLRLGLHAPHDPAVGLEGAPKGPVQNPIKKALRPTIARLGDRGRVSNGRPDGFDRRRAHQGLAIALKLFQELKKAEIIVQGVGQDQAQVNRLARLDPDHGDPSAQGDKDSVRRAPGAAPGLTGPDGHEQISILQQPAGLGEVGVAPGGLDPRAVQPGLLRRQVGDLRQQGFIQMGQYGVYFPQPRP